MTNLLLVLTLAFAWMVHRHFLADSSLAAKIVLWIGAIAAAPILGMLSDNLFVLFSVLIFIMGASVLYLYFFAGSAPDTERIRGAHLAEPRDVIRLLKTENCAAKIGDIPIPIRAEVQHFLLAGAPGSGKSLSFSALMRSARDRGQRGIVVDVGGEFLKRFYKPGDVILNPLDARGKAWSPYAEMRGPWDSDRIAKSIVADGDGPDREWSTYAQQFISAILRRTWESGSATNSQLMHLATTASVEELSGLLAGLPAAALLDPGAGKMLSSVRGIVGSHLAPFSYLDPAAGTEAFSIKSWVESEGDGWLFLTVRDDQLATMRSLISALLDVAISGLLALNPDSNRRVWFYLDEFASLGRVQSIEPLLTKARKYGGVGVIGLQSLSQFRSTYGREQAQTLLGCLGTWLVLRSPDAETSDYLSKFLGEEELRRVSESGSDQGVSWSERIERSRVVMPATLQSLPDRCGYLNIVGDVPTCEVIIPIPPQAPDCAKPFVDKSTGPAPFKPFSAFTPPTPAFPPALSVDSDGPQ